jgi:hypothetical protein
MMTNEDSAIVAQIEAQYHRYITDYPAALWSYLTKGTAIDYDALNYWSFPMLFVTGWSSGTQVSIVDRATFDAKNRALYDTYYAEGWGGGIQASATKVSVISPAAAVIETAGNRYRSDGNLFNTWNACYWLRHDGDGWKQFGIADTESPRPSAAEWVSWLSTTLS